MHDCLLQCCRSAIDHCWICACFDTAKAGQVHRRLSWRQFFLICHSVRDNQLPLFLSRRKTKQKISTKIIRFPSTLLFNQNRKGQAVSRFLLLLFKRSGQPVFAIRACLLRRRQTEKGNLARIYVLIVA